MAPVTNMRYAQISQKWSRRIASKKLSFKVSICPSRFGLFTLQNPLERSAFILLPLHQISSDIGAFEMVLFSKAFKSTPYQRYWQEYHNVQWLFLALWRRSFRRNVLECFALVVYEVSVFQKRHCLIYGGSVQFSIPKVPFLSIFCGGNVFI